VSTRKGSDTTEHKRAKVLFVRLNDREHRLCLAASKAQKLALGEWARALLTHTASVQLRRRK